MLTISLGPLTIQVAHLILLACVMAGALVAGLAARGKQLKLYGPLSDMALAALVAGRLGFVASWFSLYLAHPASVFDIRDGGFAPLGALLGAAAMAAWRSRRQPALRKPLGMGLLTALLAWSFSGAGMLQQAASQPGLPGLALTDTDGQTVTLEQVAGGHAAIVNLWATWCPPCRQEMPLLAQAQQRRPDLAFIFVNQGEDNGAIRRYLDSGQLGLRNILLDPAAALGHVVGSSALPTTLFYNAQGKLVDIHLGALSAATLEKALQKLNGGASAAAPAPPPKNPG